MKYAYGLCALLWLIAACEQRTRTVSFYYWKTVVHLGAVEKETLQYNAVSTLYIRYCDVDYAPGADEPQPISPVTLDTSVRHFRVVPVIFIKNRTFQRLDQAGTVQLAQNIFKFVSNINRDYNINTDEIQFDCDWTESTKENYFFFIDEYRKLWKRAISATIRLHQVKYPARTGIPPADQGVLMYYNMGQINAGGENSIYEKTIADKYNAFIDEYPLKLDIALPVFSWGLQIRDGKVIGLLNKFYFAQFQNDSNFRAVSSNRFITKNACFKGGYYFAEGDEVKIENVPQNTLLQMAQQLKRSAGNKTGNLIFYDLDSSNIVQYEKDIFKEVVDRLN